MEEKIFQIELPDLAKKLGTHKFEIVDISTEWCGPCQLMKDAMKKIFATPEFKQKDIAVYVVDGDLCSTLERKLDMIRDAKEEGLKFPVEENTFKEFLNKKINFNEDYTDEDMESIFIELIADLSLKQKNGKIYLTKAFELLKDAKIITKEFDVDGYPTLILYKDGKPITTPVDENDYGSRGFYNYDEELCKKDNVDMKVARIMEIEIEEGKGKKKTTKKVKVIQPNPKCDAKLVGFGSLPVLKKQLRKFLKM